ncbi:MAG: protein phosphatase 2C domain-containing protein [Dysgonamonadaceae bacterium]|jgi:protein phosphatase|nr:protein phosphatase 2C domain-containing protein [Dysgonamonadaceae bacterium]
MNIKLQRPHSISEIGKRINNEDSVFPRDEDVSSDDRLFLVCDGVGGSNKGEVASALACDAIHTYFDSFIDHAASFEPDFIEKAVRYAETRFDEQVAENHSAKGMATTLCLLYVTDEGIYAAHAGDSRIYQFRGGEILFRTEDHTLVNLWVKTGQITTEEALVHPQKNVILQALQGTKNPVEVEVAKITNVEPDDVFLMCSDGVTETFSDKELCAVMAENNSIEDKMEKIHSACRRKSRDNYSAYLIPVREVNKENVIKQVFATLFSFI